MKTDIKYVRIFSVLICFCGASLSMLRISSLTLVKRRILISSIFIDLSWADLIGNNQNYTLMIRNNSQNAFLLLLLMIGCISLQAQVNFGLKGGANYVNNVIVTDLFDNGSDYRLSYHTGVFAKIPVNRKLSFTPELLFSDKGFRILEDVASPSSEYSKLKLSYLNVPVLLGYKVFDKLSLKLGPEFGYLLSAISRFDGESTNVEQIWDNEFDVGLALGISYSITDKIGLEIRYTHGLSSVATDVQFTDILGNPIEGEDVKLQNRTFQVSVAYSLFSL